MALDKRTSEGCHKSLDRVIGPCRLPHPSHSSRNVGQRVKSWLIFKRIGRKNPHVMKDSCRRWCRQLAFSHSPQTRIAMRAKAPRPRMQSTANCKNGSIMRHMVCLPLQRWRESNPWGSQMLYFRE